MTEDKQQRLLKLALAVFFKHGYRRVEMKEIAEAAGISRAGLYLYFKTKEEIFSAAIVEYSRSKLEEVEKNIAGKKSVEDKIMYAMEIWSVQGFDRSMRSPEAREVSDCSLEFARGAVDESYKMLEEVVSSVLKDHVKDAKKRPSAAATAHLLVSAIRGFKLVARDGDGLRKLIQDMLKAVL